MPWCHCYYDSFRQQLIETEEQNQKIWNIPKYLTYLCKTFIHPKVRFSYPVKYNQAA